MVGPVVTLKNTEHTSAMERLRDKSGYDHKLIPYGQTIALAAGGYEATADRSRGGETQPATDWQSGWVSPGW